ncbi:hypothetical protein HDU87_003250 [Geranomyces variabilis]|uniref:Cystathionine gamma-synthase n=1 Tax=Geranomyces variabilis TaxID=109894 RepID=A0AAD5XMT0_9FUNG|nr:hypothetical protein HDU87_003250 [Geranomyces variabilis]
MTRSHRPPEAAAPLGTPIPDTPHAVSVSLPAWRDNVAYEEGDPCLHAALRSGYPRFVYHNCVKRLAVYCQTKFGTPAEAALVFPSRRIAAECRQFITAQAAKALETTSQSPPPPPPPPAPAIRIAELHITPTHNPYSPHSTDPTLTGRLSTTIFAVLFPTHLAALAKQFWQHSGEGVSTRFADRCLRVLAANESSAAQFDNGGLHYRAKAYTPRAQEAMVRGAEIEATRNEHDLFVEERYGRNMGIDDGENAKTVIRKRIAGVLGDTEVLGSSASENLLPKSTQSLEVEGGQISGAAPRGVAISESDVYLFPSGMSAIYNAHRVVRAIHPTRKSVQFGFPYIDTLKIQEKFGPGCHFLGFGSDEELDALERFDKDNDDGNNNTKIGDAMVPPFFRENGGISAVFCELPSNPLLKTPDLARLRRMADKYGFLLVVDETVGNFVNVDAARWADVLVSSLTKIFSGDSNVMGGSAVISPSSPHHALLTRTFRALYEDTLDPLDAVFLERNSRTFIQRIHRINATAHTLARVLAAHPKVLTVYHPSVTDSARYTAHARRNTDRKLSAIKSTPSGRDNDEEIGYGGLLSVVLRSDAAAERFYDALDVAKGPSLGTNFTLACPYTLLAHYGEMEWAEGFGVLRRLVRVSVGLEDVDELVTVFKRALDDA